jgi:hypothetical protein
LYRHKTTTQEAHAMIRISHTKLFEHDIFSTLNAFFHTFGVASFLKKVGAFKKKGVPAVSIVRELFALVFTHKSLSTTLNMAENSDYAKDVFYRFLNSCRINWMRFTTLLAGRIINGNIVNLTSDKRVNVFIVDDTPYARNRSKKTELLSRVYDHSLKKYILGFRLLTLGWSDGTTFMPVNSCLLSSENAKTRLREAHEVDKRTCGYKQRKLALSTAPVAMIEMIRAAIASGINASYVLFDSWFSMPATILALANEKLHTIAMVKKTSKIHYRYKGKMLPVTKIYSLNRKRRGRSKFLLSVNVDICSQDREKSIPARLVYVRKRGARKDYLALISTDVSLPEEEIIRIYGKRWDIEVFFKVCKSFLRLTKECHSISYDAMTAWNAIVFARYMMLALENRMQRDERSMGALFYSACNELSDITWIEAIRLLMETFLEVVADKYLLEDDEIESLFKAFIVALPEMLRNKLLQCA